MPSHNKVLIIGAGMAGLTAAAYLARAGLQVDVFEQHTLPGGYISSFSREGFVFPAGPTSFGSNGIIFPILKELGLAEKRRFARIGHQLSWGAHDIPLRSAGQVSAALAECFPEDRRGVTNYFRWVKAGAGGFKDLLNSDLMFGRGAFGAALRANLRNPLFLWAAWVAQGQTNRGLHQRYLRDPFLRQMLNQLGYPVMSGRNTLGMWSSYFYDAWIPLGGMQALANVLARKVKEFGGRIHLGQGVERILIQDGRAVGLRLRDGQEHAGIVFSAADLRRTAFDLIGREHLPQAAIQKLENAQPSESIFTVYLGVRETPRLALSLRRFQESHVWFTPSNGAPYIQLTWLNKEDPSVAPAGCHALFLGAMSPYEDWAGLRATPQAYQARKQAVADEIIERAEEFLPGLRESIWVRDSASPLTFERYTGNWRGATAGWSWDPQRAPRIQFDEDFPIKDFYAAGHYLFAPGGVPTAMITAWYVARNILKKTL